MPIRLETHYEQGMALELKLEDFSTGIARSVAD